MNANTKFNALFDVEEVDLTTDDAVQLSEAALDQLENEQAK